LKSPNRHKHKQKTTGSKASSHARPGSTPRPGQKSPQKSTGPKSGKAPRPDAIHLSKQLVKAWEDTLLKTFRPRRGSGGARPDNTDGAQRASRLKQALMQETDTILELWEIFTKDRGRLSRYLLTTRQHVVGYLLGFHLPNAARMQVLLHRTLRRLPLAEGLKRCSEIRVSDIGCGTGAMAQTLVVELAMTGVSPAKMRISLSDVSPPLLETAADSITALNMPLTVSTHRKRAEELPIIQFQDQPPGATSIGGQGLGAGPVAHIYTFGYVWNELRKNPAAQRRIHSILAGHIERGEVALVLIVEPGTELQARDAMQLRDELTASRWSAVYPCPASSPCPMLERPKDWCFSEAAWTRPALVEMIDRRLGIDRTQIAAGMYAFATPALTELAGFGTTTRQVVVGRPLRDAADGTPTRKSPTPLPRERVRQRPFEYLVCTPDGLAKVPQVKSPTGSPAQMQPILRGSLLST